MLQVRTATLPSDVEHLIRGAKFSWDEIRATDDELNIPFLVLSLQAYMELGACAMFIVEDDGEPVGGAACIKTQCIYTAIQYCELAFIYVLPTYRERNVGAWLMREVLKWAKDNHLADIRRTSVRSFVRAPFNDAPTGFDELGTIYRRKL